MTPIDRRSAFRLAAGSAILTGGSLGGASAAPPGGEGTLAPFHARGRGAIARTVNDKLSEFVSITDFGAVGDHVPGKAPGHDNAAAILAALDASPDVFVPAGRYRLTGWPALRRILDSTFFGPGHLYYDDGKHIELLGSFVRAGVCDPDGRTGTLTQGGFVVGGEGPGIHGTLIHAQHPSWPVMKPTRGGSAVELQIYSYGYLGAARCQPGRAIIDAVYGDFGSPNIEEGDVLGFGDRIYRILSKPSKLQLELGGIDGKPITFADDSTKVFRHAYYYGEGICTCAGVDVSRISGDNFFDLAAVAGQKTISIGGKRWPIAKVIDTNQLVLAEAAGAFAASPYVMKMLPLSLHVSLLRLQGLSGGSEETFSVAESIDGLLRMRTGGHGYGDFRPIAIGTGPDEDFGYHRDHLVISKSGQIGLGKNYVNPDIGFPTAAKVHVWRDGVQKAEKDGTHDVRIAVFETNHAGPTPRQLHIGCLNNYHCGYIQGYVDRPGQTPGPITLNPFGGAVGINTGRDSVLTHALEVEGAVAPHSDAHSGLGAASHRWSTVYAATGMVQTSDADEKQDVTAIPDELIDAFLDVEPKVFRWRASISEKGDAARHHLGYVAQEIAGALSRKGVDPARFGLWCQDELSETVEADDGELTSRATGRFRQALRYDQLLALIDAANRRRLSRIEERLSALEQRL